MGHDQDVYKRQVYFHRYEVPVRDFLGMGFAMRLYEKIRCFFLGSTDMLLKDRRFVIDESVSYTHLDVYKRQAVNT